MKNDCMIPSTSECECGARYKYRWTHKKTGKTGVREMLITPICKQNYRYRFSFTPSYKDIFFMLLSDWNKCGPWKYEEYV